MSLTKRYLEQVSDFNARELSPDAEERAYYADMEQAEFDRGEDGFTDAEFRERMDADLEQ